MLCDPFMTLRGLRCGSGDSSVYLWVRMRSVAMKRALCVLRDPLVALRGLCCGSGDGRFPLFDTLIGGRSDGISSLVPDWTFDPPVTQHLSSDWRLASLQIEAIF